MEKSKDKKIRILAWGDSIAVNTGFGTVMRGIFQNLAKTGKYEIDLIGINDTGGWKDPELYPNIHIYPALPGNSMSNDFHGRNRLLDSLWGKDSEIRPSWDLVFTLNDPFILDLKINNGHGTMDMIVRSQYAYILSQPPKNWFKIISYWPVDSKLKSNWIKDTIALPDRIVAYTEYGKKEMVEANKRLTSNAIPKFEDKIQVLYHGYDQDKYFPISEEEKKKFREKFFAGQINNETFIVSVVGRNQMRKDIPRAMKIFAEFKKRRPDSFLYIHAKKVDAWGNLEEYANELGLKLGEDYGVPGNFNERIGMSFETLNKIYNVSDVILSTNLGEGFGMTYIEAMGAGTINLAPFHTTTPELFKLISPEIDETSRGLAFKAGSTSSEFIFMGPDDLTRERPLGNVEDAVKKLIWIYDNPEKVKVIQDNASKWISEYTWENIAKQWDDIFMNAYAELEDDRKNAESIKDQVKKAIQGQANTQDAS